MLTKLPTGGIQEVLQANRIDRCYNGYTNEQRALANRPQREERNKPDRNPTKCCVTGFTRPDDLKGKGRLYLHLENYDEPLNWYPMSKRSHHLLHRRFLEPKPWLRLVAKNYKEGAWYTLLTMDVRDMYKSYDEIYPHGLPSAHELWPPYADELGISGEL